MRRFILLLAMALGFGSQLALAKDTPANPQIYKCPKVTMNNAESNGWVFEYSESNSIPIGVEGHWPANGYMWCLYNFSKDGIARELKMPIPPGSTCVEIDDDQFSCSKN